MGPAVHPNRAWWRPPRMHESPSLCLSLKRSKQTKLLRARLTFSVLRTGPYNPLTQGINWNCWRRNVCEGGTLLKVCMAGPLINPSRSVPSTWQVLNRYCACACCHLPPPAPEPLRKHGVLQTRSPARCPGFHKHLLDAL